MKGMTQLDKDLEAVRKNGYALEHVKTQTPEICMAAVKQEGIALKYVITQTPEICLEAVKQNGYALGYVKVQTPEICLAAVSQSGYALGYVKDQTPELCLEAVKNNGYAIRFVKNQTPELCMEAVKQNEWALQHVKTQTLELCFLAIKECGWTLECVNPDLMCSDLYLLGLCSVVGYQNIDTYFDLINKMTGKELDKQIVSENIDNIRNGIGVIEILKSDMGYLQFINSETLRTEDYHEVLDYIIESGLELTDYQREQLNKLDKKYDTTR